MKHIVTALKYIYWGIIVRFVVMVILGLNVRHRERLPRKGPVVLVANHNSHLDTMVLVSLLPLGNIAAIHPVAAADYFLKNRLLAWFTTEIIGIIPITRGAVSRQKDPFEGCCKALEKKEILIFFPEGSRGEPEEMTAFKKGIARLAEKYTDVPFLPVFMHGLGKALPKGEALLVPFFCDVYIGEEVKWTGSRQTFMGAVEDQINAMQHDFHEHR